MPKTITIFELAAALGCSDQNISRREERGTMPKAISEGKPRTYELNDVLWIVGGAERQQICKYLKIKTTILVTEPGSIGTSIPEEKRRDSLMF